MKAVLLLSGGLDSTLAGKVLLELGLEVYAFNATSPFCTCTRKGKSCHQASFMAHQLGIPIKVIGYGEEYLEIVRNPKFGWGKGANPCIDCRILLLKKAKEFATEIGAAFFVTGDVIGQRPKSQRLWALKTIEREAGVEGLVLRPLSAKLLPPTKAEKSGWVAREKLLAIQGRSRKRQMELAQTHNISDYPCPAGGCLLTVPEFALRVKDSIKHGEFTLAEVPLLKVGRHFRFPDGSKLIVGRNEGENKILSSHKNNLVEMTAKDVPSPIGLFRPKSEEFFPEAAGIVLKYSDFKGEEGEVEINFNSTRERIIKVCPAGGDKINQWLIQKKLTPH